MGIGRKERLSALLLVVLAAGLGAQDLGNLGARRMELRQAPHLKRLKGHDLADARQEADRWWFGGEPSAAYLDARNRLAAQELAQMRRQTAQRAGTPSWVNLGPTANLTTAAFPDVDSGRLTAVVQDPRTDRKVLYVATAGGGVFKCANADHSLADDAWVWQSITDTLPALGGWGNLPIGAFTLDPSAPDTLFVGLGDAFDGTGRGLYKSTDGGVTWKAAEGMGNATRIASILVVNASTILAATDDGLKVSNDGGVTFKAAPSPLNAGRSWSLAKLGASILVSHVTSSTGAIFYSDDLGATWKSSDFSKLPFTPKRITLGTSPSSATQGWAMAENGSSVARGLMRTTDGGRTFDFVPAPGQVGGLFQGVGGSMGSDGGQAWYNHGFAVDPTDVNRVFLGANLALYRTEDGGMNWTQLTHWYASRRVYGHADFHTSNWSSDGSTLYIGNDGGLLICRNPRISSSQLPMSSNGAVNSQTSFIDNRRNRGLATHLIYNLGSTIARNPPDARHRITLGLQDNGTRVRQPKGSVLEGSSVFEDQVGGDGFGTLIHPEDGDLMLGSVYFTQIVKSTNGGSTQFGDAMSGISEAGSSSAAPFRSKLALGAASEPDTVYTITNQKVYKSTNFGTTWQALGMSGFSGTLRNVTASRSNPQALAVAVSSGAFGVSYNGGSSWKLSTVPGGGTTANVWFDTENDQILYGTLVHLDTASSHLYKSTNGGSTWTALDGTPTQSNGFPYGIPVHVIQNQPGNSNLLYAGTDFGVYRSTNGGASWERFGTGMPLVAVRDLYVAPDGSFIRAGSYGRGVWEISPTETNTALSITKHPVGVTVVEGGTATFTVEATGTQPFTYVWRKNGTDLPGTNSATLTLNPVKTSDAGAYTVRVSNSLEAVVSSAATLTVVPPSPTAIFLNPSSAVLMTGQSQAFIASVYGPANTAVNWTLDGPGSISGTTGGIVTYTATAAGTATLKATAAADATKFQTATITVRSRDLNKDGVVDVLDLAWMAQAYGNASFLATADLNGDGQVNGDDVTLLLAGL